MLSLVEITALSTVAVLSDADERSKGIGIGAGSDQFSLPCFERAIGLIQVGIAFKHLQRAHHRIL